MAKNSDKNKMLRILAKLKFDNASVCPKCGENTDCLDSRDYGYKMRKKCCRGCGYIFKTVEVIEDDIKRIDKEIDEEKTRYNELETVVSAISRFAERGTHEKRH